MTTSNLNAAAGALEQAVTDAWAAAYTASGLTFGDMSYDPPEGTAIWARVTIIWGTAMLAAQGGAGAGMNIAPGTVMVSLFGLPGKGDGPLTAAADVVRDALMRKRFAGPPPVTTMVPSPPRLAENPEDRRWRQMIVRVPFEVDETI